MSEYELSLMTVIVIFIVVAIAFTGVFPIGLANGMNAKPPENCNLKAEADGDGDSISAELDLYQFSQPEHLYAVDLRDADIETLVLLTSLQGVVNRKKPRIFVLTNEKNVSGEIVCYENLWLEYYQKEKEIDYTLVENAFSLLAMFENEVGGYVIYDPASLTALA